jgi:pantoate--beta-alanine ligase
MIRINTIQQLKNQLTSFRNQGKSIGFVPTMGALHQGHISLVNAAKSECDIVVCSIFVNPTQFNDLNDLANYPRTLEIDSQLLEEAGCDIVFSPAVTEMYSEAELELKRQKKEDKSWAEGKVVDFGSLAKVMEGAQRPGHFNGVAQVVSKLFRIVGPQKAFFGQKDFQQLAIIRSMVNQLGMPIEIIACPIIREANGLAMSSRNQRLTEEEREQASAISRVLFKVKELYLLKNVEELKALAVNEIKLVPQLELEYFEIADAETLQAVASFSKVKSAVACIAVKIGAVRLIDNVLLY